MADLDATKVAAGQALLGGAYIAPVGTALPTDATTVLPAAWVSLGYFSEDGVTKGQELETEDIMSWQSASPLRTLITSRLVSVEFTMLEVKMQTLALWYGQALPASGTDDSFTLEVRSDKALPEMPFVLQLQDGPKSVRFVAPRAQMSEAGDQEITRDGLVGWPVTLKTLDQNGILCYEYVDTTVTP